MSYLGWIERSFFKYVNSCSLGIAICLVDPISIYLCESFETTTKQLARDQKNFFFHFLDLTDASASKCICTCSRPCVHKIFAKCRWFLFIRVKKSKENPL